MIELIYALVIGLIAVIVRIALGYFKSNESFESKKVAGDIVLGLVLGPILYIYAGITDMTVLFATIFVGDVAISELLKGFARRA